MASSSASTLDNIRLVGDSDDAARGTGAGVASRLGVGLVSEAEVVAAGVDWVGVSGAADAYTGDGRDDLPTTPRPKMVRAPRSWILESALVSDGREGGPRRPTGAMETGWRPLGPVQCFAALLVRDMHRSTLPPHTVPPIFSSQTAQSHSNTHP